MVVAAGRQTAGFFSLRRSAETPLRSFDFVAEININAGGGVSFLLFHVAEIKPQNGEAGEKISRDGTAGEIYLIYLRNAEAICRSRLLVNDGVESVRFIKLNMAVGESEISSLNMNFFRPSQIHVGCRIQQAWFHRLAV